MRLNGLHKCWKQTLLCNARSSAVDTTICRRVTASGRTLILTRWFFGLYFSSAVRSLPDVDPVIANCAAGSNGPSGSSECSMGSDSVITLFCFMVLFCRQALFFCKTICSKTSIAFFLPSSFQSFLLFHSSPSTAFIFYFVSSIHLSYSCYHHLHHIHQHHSSPYPTPVPSPPF